MLIFIEDLNYLSSLIPELEPFYSAHFIDDIDRDNTEDEQLESEFEDSEIVRIHDEESRVMQDEEGKIEAHILIV